MKTDYYVVSFPEIQRQLYSPEMLAWFAAQTPVRVVTTIDGEYARIYDVRGMVPPPPFYLDAPKVKWDGVGTVIGVRLPEARRTDGKSVGVTLLVQTNGVPGSVRMQAQMLAPDGSQTSTISKVVKFTPDENGIAEIRVNIPIPTTITPERYRVVYRLADPETGNAIAATDELQVSPISGDIYVGTVVIR